MQKRKRLKALALSMLLALTSTTTVFASTGDIIWEDLGTVDQNGNLNPPVVEEILWEDLGTVHYPLPNFDPISVGVGAGTAIATGATLPLSGPAILVGLAVTLTGVAVYDNWDYIKGGALHVWQKLSSVSKTDIENAIANSNGSAFALSGATIREIQGLFSNLKPTVTTLNVDTPFTWHRTDFPKATLGTSIQLGSSTLSIVKQDTTQACGAVGCTWVVLNNGEVMYAGANTINGADVNVNNGAFTVIANISTTQPEFYLERETRYGEPYLVLKAIGTQYLGTAESAWSIDLTDVLAGVVSTATATPDLVWAPMADTWEDTGTYTITLPSKIDKTSTATVSATGDVVVKTDVVADTPTTDTSGITGLLGKIAGLLESIPRTILDGLKTLFVPEETYFPTKIGNIGAVLEEKLGLGEYLDMFADTLNGTTEREFTDIVITLPSLPEGINKFTVLSSEPIKTAKKYTDPLIKGGVFILLILYNYGEVYKLIRGTSPYKGGTEI